MQDNKIAYYKNYIIVAYVFLCSIFCVNSIIFNQGLLVGFLAGCMIFVPSVWFGAICFTLSMIMAIQGEFVSYLIVLGYIFLIGIIQKKFFYQNQIIKYIIYSVAYIPCIFIFQLTLLFHIANFLVSLAIAGISEQITCRFCGMQDLSVLFSNCFPNCFMLFIIGISSPTMNLWHFNLYHVIFALATLTYSKQADEKTCIWSMIFLSLGGYLAGLEYSTFIFAICVFSTLAVCEWSSGISLSVYLISFIAVSFFINDVNFDINSAIISAVAGGLVFLAVPHKKIKEISAKNKYASQKDIINRDRSKIAIKIEELSSCFLKIAQGYNEIAKSKYKQSDSIKYITCETIKHICENCDKFSFCNKSDVWRNAELDYLSQCAMQKGKTTMLDFGDFISSSCVRKVDLLGEINKIASNAKNQVLQLEEKQKSKEEVARTYQRVAVVLEKLSLEASKKISFDSNAQLEISQALDKATVFYRELFIYQNENKCVCVELFARKDDAGEILSCIERIFGYNFHLASSRNQYEDSCDYMIFCKSPRVNVEYGYATKPKKHGHPNGDSMTIINLPDARFVCVICDGMGSGESAHEFSQKAVSFIENLFSAGFVASDIITNVNSFMENCEYNSYATLDILEIDLYSEKAYLYKVGSPDTYFQSTKTHLISSKALPIGIMKEIKLEINSFGVSKGDKIILTSDGVLDFMRAEIENGINNKSFVSSQVFADRIMQECDKKMTRGSSDDRTIIAIEII